MRNATGRKNASEGVYNITGEGQPHSTSSTVPIACFNPLKHCGYNIYHLNIKILRILPTQCVFCIIFTINRDSFPNMK